MSKNSVFVIVFIVLLLIMWSSLRSYNSQIKQLGNQVQTVTKKLGELDNQVQTVTKKLGEPGSQEQTVSEKQTETTSGPSK